MSSHFCHTPSAPPHPVRYALQYPVNVSGFPLYLFRLAHKETLPGNFTLTAQIHQKFIFDASRCISCQLISFFYPEGIDCFNQSNGSNRYQIFHILFHILIFFTTCATRRILCSIRICFASRLPSPSCFKYCFSSCIVNGDKNVFNTAPLKSDLLYSMRLPGSSCLSSFFISILFFCVFFLYNYPYEANIRLYHNK